MARELQEVNQSGELTSMVLAEKVKLVPQAVSPTHEEGLVFYDDATHSLSVYTDVPGVTLNITQEEVIRVHNGTLAAIPNATPITVTGLVSANNVPEVTPAIASSPGTARVPGITTSQIGSGEEGWVTHAGNIGGDFSAYNNGDVLYLSDTVAGGLVTVAPNYATKLGMVLVGETDGKMVASIESNIALPTIIGYMNGGSGPATITGTYEDIANYANFGNVGLPIDQALGHINVPTTGIYRMTLNLNISFTPQNATKTVTLQLWDVTDASEVFSVAQALTKNAESASFALSTPFDAIAGRTYVCRVMTDNDMNGVTYQATSFDFESIHLRE